MNKAALILIQVLCLTVFVSAGTGLIDLHENLRHNSHN